MLGPMCQWSMSATDDRIEQGLVRGITRWATSSPKVAVRRLWLIGHNGTIAGAMYLPRLVNEVLNTLGKQLVDDGRLGSVSLYSAGPTPDFPQLDTQERQEDDYDQQGNLLVPIKVKEGKREDIDWVLQSKSSQSTFPKANARDDKADHTH